MTVLRVCFLWHMHQPWYVDLDGGRAILPWARLHALKDYLDIPGTAAEFPRLTQTFNWVPALLDQVARAAAGGSDPHLDAARLRAADLDGATRRFLVDEFFSIGDREVRAIPAYRRLRDRVRGFGTPEAAAEGLSVDELRDLQVFFHLAWSGHRLREHPVVATLLRRRRHFTEEEKDGLLGLQQEFLSNLLPELARLAASGAFAVSTSPYHHPILPLLFEPATAAADDPSLVPPARIAPRPADALAQVRLGRETFARHFGWLPNGMWPPEGAVGPETVRRLGDEGIVWLATDEAILRNSLPPARRWAEGDLPSRTRNISRPWRLAGRGPALFFRDRELSDRIGFVYSAWGAEEAADDFVARLRQRAESVAPPAAITIALDGENAWEHYEESGRPFLRALFGRLAAAEDLRVCGFEEAIAEVPAEELPALRCGSWIDGNLHTWAGDEEKNRAWTLLSDVAATVDQVVDGAPPQPLPELTGRVPPAGADPGAARAAMLAAEASDWFWWFGEGHSSAHDADFDRLFRSHLAAAVRFSALPARTDLARPVRRPRAPAVRRSPSGPISAVLDGRMTDYYEWLSAGRALGSGDGTMHLGSGRVRELHFGTDGRNLFLRLDPKEPPASERFADLTIRVHLESPRRRELVLPIQEADVAPGEPCAVAKRILEARVPISETPLPGATRIAFAVELADERGRLLQRIPGDGWIELPAAEEDWSV